MLAAFTFFSLTPAHAVVPTAERQALENLYNNTNGATWTNVTNWLSGDPCENNWDGIICDSSNTHVERVLLGARNLDGTLPDLSALTELYDLSVMFNSKLTGAIPPLPAKLGNFNAGYCALSGAIPALPANLERFEASGNNLTALPSSLPATLLTFDVSGNKTIAGAIPALPFSLKEFRAGENQLSGPLPALPASLEVFIVTGNRLSGAMPASLHEGLKVFEVGHNKLEGLPPTPPSSLTGGSLCLNPLTPRGSAPAALVAAWDAVDASIWRDKGGLVGCTPMYYYDVSITPSGSGSFSCFPSLVFHGEDMECYFPPKEGYIFAGATASYDFDGSTASISCDTGTRKCTISGLTDKVTVTATFKAESSTDTSTTDTGTDTGSSTDTSASSQPVPTLSEVGLLLSGFALAGAAAPALRRRERKERKRA